MKSARQVAFEVLLKVERDGAYSNLAVAEALKENPQLDERDGAFVRNLVYGALERLILIDYNLGLYLNRPSRKPRAPLRTVLRMGAYQLLFMDRVPARAAINESVELAKVNKSAFAASLVNAVLRRVAENGLRLPEAAEDDPNYLAIKYSCPEWIISLWRDAYGLDAAVSLARAALEKPPTVVRANTTRISADELIWRFAEEGVVSYKTDMEPDALIIEGTAALEELLSYKEGLFHVQDLASQLCCRALDPREGETVFDLCSAPGGKAFSAAELMNDAGTVRAFDIYQSRTDLIRSGAARLGLKSVFTYLSDSRIFNENYGSADKVLCDVPCSGLGVIRRKPEIRFKSAADIDNLPKLQYLILCNGAKYLKPGGRLVYSTCALNPRENSEVCDGFLLERPDFEAVEIFPELPRLGGEKKYLTLFPHVHSTDGFFIAAFVKNGGRR